MLLLRAFAPIFHFKIFTLQVLLVEVQK